MTSVSKKFSTKNINEALVDDQVPNHTKKIEEIFIVLLVKIIQNFPCEAVWWFFPFVYFDMSPVRLRIYHKISNLIDERVKVIKVSTSLTEGIFESNRNDL